MSSRDFATAKKNTIINNEFMDNSVTLMEKPKDSKVVKSKAKKADLSEDEEKPKPKVKVIKSSKAKKSENEDEIEEKPKAKVVKPKAKVIKSEDTENDENDEDLEEKPKAKVVKPKVSKIDVNIKTCAYVYTKGRNIGQTCPTTVKDDNDMCKIHMTSVEKKKNASLNSSTIEKSGIKCEYIYKKGKNKDSICTSTNAFAFNNLCKAHGGKNEDDEDENSEGCQAILAAGIRKGEKCNKKLNVESETLCDYHFKKSNKSENNENSEETPCTFILTRGDRKGSQCGKKVCKNSDSYCATHFKSSSSSNTSDSKPIKKIKTPTKSSNSDEDCEESNSDDICEYIFGKGKNKGEKCSKKTDGCGCFCKTHAKTQTSSSNSLVDNENKCSYILSSGKNKGNKCPSKAIKDGIYCTKHSKSNEKSNSKLTGSVAKVAKKIKNDIYDELNNIPKTSSSDEECQDEDLISVKNDDDDEGSDLHLSENEVIESDEEDVNIDDLSDVDV